MTPNKANITTFAVLLVITGLLSALTIASAEAVMIGFILLLLPGFILAYAPVAFIMLSSFFVVWFVASKFSNTKLATALGVLAIVVSLTLPPMLDESLTKARIAATAKAEIKPQGRLALKGDILLKLPERTFDLFQPESQEARCSGLCVDLLYIPGVTSVIEERVNHLGQSDVKRYRLQTGDACMTAQNASATRAVKPLSVSSDLVAGTKADVTAQREREFAANSICVVRESVIPPSQDYRIAYALDDTSWEKPSWMIPSQYKVEAEVFEVADKTGKPIFRASRYWSYALAMPLRTGYGVINNAPVIGWATQTIAPNAQQNDVLAALRLSIFGAAAVPQPTLP
jgi:hypothetical protein